MLEGHHVDYHESEAYLGINGTSYSRIIPSVLYDES